LHTLPHGGVLFLDELAEFAAPVLDSLRQPLEEGRVRVSRVHASVEFPARFLLVAATNPCPCGQGGPQGGCRCSDAARVRYARRLSGPLLDRFDLRVMVRRPKVAELLGPAGGECSAAVATRVSEARDLAWRRQGCENARLAAAALAEHAPLTRPANTCIAAALRSGRLTARGYHRVVRVARTLADLARRDGPLDVEDVVTALQLRTEIDLAELAA
jgi:magnesium chelatase family protein